VSTYPTSMAKPEQIRSALKIYRVLAVIAGLALFVLLAAMFVKYGPPKDATGFVPILPFIAERRVTADTEAVLSRAYLTGPGGSDVQDSTGSAQPGGTERPAPGR